MNVFLADSPIHGRGVFAYERIEEGHWQWVYGQRRMVKSAVIIGELEDGHPTGAKHKDGYEPWMDYCFEWDRESLFLPDPPFRFLNHSNNPNCEVVDSETGNFIMVVEALRNIEPNEELTIDYGYDPSED